MSRSILSLDIGSKNIKCLVGKRKKKGISVKGTSLVPTPEGAYESGQLLQVDALATAIRTACKSKGFRAKKAIITIHSPLAIIREIVLPKVKKKELTNMIQYEIEQFLTIDFNEYDIQYKVLEEVEVAQVKKNRILIAALPKKVIESYLELIKNLHLKPLALNLHANAISSFHMYQMENNMSNYSLEKTTAFIDLGFESMNVYIVRNGLFSFNRSVSMGFKMLLEDVANSYDLTVEEAEEKVREFGNLQVYQGELIQETLLNELIMNNVDKMVEELRKVFRYYNSRKQGNAVDGIILYGGGSSIMGLEHYLTEQIEIPVQIIDGTTKVKIKGQHPGKKVNLYCNCLGALIRG